jgi:hypothetical protein
MGHNILIITAQPENYNGSSGNFPDSGLFSTAGIGKLYPSGPAGSGIQIRKGMRSRMRKQIKRIAAAALAAAGLTVWVCGASSVASLFTDVDPAADYAGAVEWAAERGITKGTGDGTLFSPTAICTRGQMAVLLWRAAGSPEPALTETQFMDVTDPSAYNYKAIQWAAEMDMEFSGIFRPQDPCTRFDAAFFLWRAAGSPEPAERLNIADMVEEENLQFLHPIESVYWAVERGIIPCTGDGTTFSAGESCKRGEIAVFLYRAASALSGTDS